LERIKIITKIKIVITTKMALTVAVTITIIVIASIIEGRKENSEINIVYHQTAILIMKRPKSKNAM
jgi:hypothetical protein